MTKDIRNFAGVGLGTVILSTIVGGGVGVVLGQLNHHAPTIQAENVAPGLGVSGAEAKAQQDLKRNVEFTPKATEDLATKYNKIKVGWTKKQVRDLLGEPTVLQGDKPTNSETSSFWNYIPEGDTQGVKAIQFDKTGKVTELNAKAG